MNRKAIFRIGDHRVVFDLDDNNIVILRIGHRKNIYKIRTGYPLAQEARAEILGSSHIS